MSGPGILIPDADPGYTLHYTDSGCFVCGWYLPLSTGWCVVEIACWYRGAH